MTWLSWILLIGYFLLNYPLSVLFTRAGEDGKKAYIPIYNFMIWSKIIGRKESYGLLMLIPVLNIFIFSALAVDLARSFGRLSFLEHVAAVVASPFYFGWLALVSKDEYQGPAMKIEREHLAKMEAARKAKNEREYNKLVRTHPFGKPVWQEWAESAIFAVFAATLIRLLFIEPYIIPTPSMEGSLMVGDFLFVSKVHYGMRLPETVLQLPLVHNRAPFGAGESYLEKPSLPYRRLPAVEALDRYDPVVFNMPAGDSVYIFPDRTYTDQDYRTGIIESVNPRYAQAIKTGRVKLVTRPRDKKDLYVKRAIGVPGDTLQMIDRKLYIDGKLMEDPENVQFLYMIRFSNSPNRAKWTEMGIAEDDVQTNGETFLMHLSNDQLAELKAGDPGIQVENVNFDAPGRTGIRQYPHNEKYYGNWSNDNFGPLWIPAAGATITLTEKNFPLYFRPIKVYEGNESFNMRNGKFYLNGEEITTYTFKQDYYWCMGDNRHNSEDSRVWGFVPFDHVVGKPLFIWFSIRENSFGKGIAWDRIFSSAQD